MSGNLETTNLLLGIMAAVSLLEAITLIAIGVTMFRMYRRAATTAEAIESRYLSPMVSQLSVVLDDVKEVMTTVKADTERVEHAIQDTMVRLDDTADRMRTNVRFKTRHMVGLVRGVRAAIEEVLRSREAAYPSRNSILNTVTESTHE
jgi:argininosuccinate lyase